MTFDLAALIKTAQAVPTVTIPPGVYPAQSLTGVKPAAVVHIACTGVTFAGLAMVDCANLSFEGLSVVQPPVAQGSPAVKLQNCVGVTFVKPNLSGTADPVTGLYMGKAAQIMGGAFVAFRGGEASQFFKGINPASTDDFTLSGMDLHHIRTSAFEGFGQRLTFDGNHVHDLLRSTTFDHHDGGHIFTKGHTVPCDSLKITGNRFDLADANGAPCINLEGTPASRFTNALIADNIINWNDHTAIFTNWLESGAILRNVLKPLPGLDNPAHAPGIAMSNNGAGLVVEGNTCAPGPSMKPFAAQNTFLTAGQIAQMGAKV